MLIRPDSLNSLKPDAFADSAAMETEQRHVGAVRPLGCTSARTRTLLQAKAAGWNAERRTRREDAGESWRLCDAALLLSAAGVIDLVLNRFAAVP